MTCNISSTAVKSHEVHSLEIAVAEIATSRAKLDRLLADLCDLLPTAGADVIAAIGLVRDVQTALETATEELAVVSDAQAGQVDP